MEPVGLGFAALSMAELCIKMAELRYGQILITKYRSYQNAERELSELMLRVEHHWMKTESQVVFLHSVWPSLGERLQVHQNHVLQVIYFKISEAINLVDETIGKGEDDGFSINSLAKKKGSLRRVKYAMTLKESLEKVLVDLTTWQGMLDPSWFLIARIPNKAIDQQLIVSQTSQFDSLATMRGLRSELMRDPRESNEVSSIFLQPDCLVPERVSIPFSFSQISRDPHSTASVIVDTFFCDEQADLNRLTRDVRDLAKVLSKVDPLIFGLLSCRGAIKSFDESGTISKFEFVFSSPTGLKDPTSLRSLLLAGDCDYALNDRLDLAKQLASSVLFIHTSQFVHKNIRPETILVFKTDNSQGSAIGVPFLVGFEKFRPLTGRTYRAGDQIWERDLYRHPKRQGPQPEEDFIMQHDIYSLGVCLLEIGLWTSFVHWKQESNEAIASTALDISDILLEKDQRKKAFELKRILVQMAEHRLPSRMGKKYTEIVVSCLTCLDVGNGGFGDENNFLDEDGISLGVRYIEKILMRIKEISV